MQKCDKEVREMLEERIRVKSWMRVQLKENIERQEKQKVCQDRDGSTRLWQELRN